MKISSTFYKIAASASVLVAAVTMAAPQSVLADTVGNLCLALNTNECVVAHGVGGIPTIQGSGYNIWSRHLLYTNQNNNPVYNFINGSNNCLFYDGGQVTVRDNTPSNCANNINAQWVLTSSGSPNRYMNDNYGCYLGTWGDTSGNKVYCKNQQSGFWSGWTMN